MSKICPSCGTACDDTQAFCPRCGSKLPAQQQPYGQQPPYGQQQYGQQQPYGYGQQPPQYGQPPQYSQGPALGMKWFKFIIWFQLFATALLNVISGISALTGSQYGSSADAELVYMFFPSLKTVDMIYGICLIVLAAGAIFVRMQLAGFRTNAPKLYLGLLAAAVAANLIYLVAAASILSDLGLDFTSNISQLATSVVMIVVNSIYFKKREHLFVN